MVLVLSPAVAAALARFRAALGRYYAEDREADAWVGLSPLPFSTSRAAEQRARGLLLFRDIERDGVRA